MKEYFNGFSTQDLVDMKRNDEKRKEKVEMEKEIERLTKGIAEIIQEINSLEIGSDQETYNKEGYIVDVYDIKDMLVELIGSDKE